MKPEDAADPDGNAEHDRRASADVSARPEGVEHTEQDAKPKLVERLTQRWAWLGRILAVKNRFVELHGAHAANAVALTLFVSLFPLLLVVVSVVGWRAGVDAELGGRIADELGLTGRSAEMFTDTVASARHSAKAGSIIGLVGLAWSGLKVFGALQYLINLAWQAPKRGAAGRLLGIPWIIGGGVGFVASVAVTSVLAWLPGWTAPLAFGVGVTLDVALFVWTFWLLGSVRLPVRALLPGALFAAFGVEVLKVVGTVVVPRLVAGSSAVYGSLGLVFAVLTWLVIFARLLMYASIINVVRYEREFGTVTLEVEVPDLPGVHAVGVTRGGAVETDADVSP